MKNKIFVTLSLIAAGFYTLEIALTIIDRGFINLLIVKVILVAAFLTYAIKLITKNKVTQADEEH